MRYVYSRSTLLLSSALLVVALVIFFLPLTWSVQCLILSALFFSILKAKSWLQTAQNLSKPKLNIRELSASIPVIIVIGPHASALFSGNGSKGYVIENSNAIWWHAHTPAQLDIAIASIYTSHQRFPQAALLPVLSDHSANDTALRSEFAQWQRALSGITNHLDYKLPCYVAVYAQLAGQRGLYAPAMATWISEVSDLVNIPRSHHDLQSSIQKTKQRLEHSVLSSLCPIDVKRNILAQALLEWLNDTALITTLTTFTRTAPLTPSGVILADVASHSHSGAWTSWITAKTGLQPILTTYPISPLPLPNFLPLPLPDEPNDGGRHVVPSWCDGYKAAWLVMIVLCLALTTSTWNNQQFITRLARNLDIYWKTPDIRSDEKRKALQTLIRDQAQLQEISSMGIPIHLSGGLYRGMIFLPLIENVIANYRSAETNSFTLNSILLFDTGKAMLKTDATPLLHQALEKLQANAAKTVLIAGHTDNIGNPDSNITLSEARARAVRDWFVKNSNFPITHFAIQGYGDSRPITDNRNEISRANNRRVDITLLSKDTTTNPEVREPPVIHNKVTN